MTIIRDIYKRNVLHLISKKKHTILISFYGVNYYITILFYKVNCIILKIYFHLRILDNLYKTLHQILLWYYFQLHNFK